MASVRSTSRCRTAPAPSKQSAPPVRPAWRAATNSTRSRRGPTRSRSRVSVIENVTVDQPVAQDAFVGEPALITGTVYRSSDGNALGGAQVKLFLVSQYPTVV